MTTPIVYFTPEISPESLVRIYNALGVALTPKVAVKLSTGEPPGEYWLHPELIKSLVSSVSGTIVECNTAYKGKRTDSSNHWKVIEDNGFTTIANCYILDEDSDMSIPIENGRQITQDFVGDHLKNYGSILVLSHFKGHQMAGYGGALKNISIGLASSYGKVHIHNYGTNDNPEWIFKADNVKFVEAMADAAKGVIDYMGKDNMVYINVANNISIDCDCDGHPKKPEIPDIGIFASTDPVAVDSACLKAIFSFPIEGTRSLINRINERHGMHIIESAESLGIGSSSFLLRRL